jgi:hypothetical protein
MVSWFIKFLLFTLQISKKNYIICEVSHLHCKLVAICAYKHKVIIFDPWRFCTLRSYLFCDWKKLGLIIHSPSTASTACCSEVHSQFQELNWDRKLSLVSKWWWWWETSIIQSTVLDYILGLTSSLSFVQKRTHCSNFRKKVFLFWVWDSGQVQESSNQM